MNQQHPQQPNWGQQPQQQWGAPQQQPGWGAPLPPPKKSNTGRNIGLGCAGIFAVFVVIGVIGAAVGGGSDDTGSKDNAVSSETADEAKTGERPKTEEAKEDDKPKAAEAKKDGKPKVVFKVWGNAPAGSLGPLDITYGSDSDTRKGAFKDGTFEATLPLDDDALYFNVMAQLQGSGDINCSVTIDGHTEKAHAAGGYNICNAQANKGILGGWD